MPDDTTPAHADYHAFLDHKAQLARPSGFTPIRVHDFLYPFQRALLEWALRIGRGLILADCGLGKTPISLAWADNVVRHTGSKVLILTPLAVAGQFVREGEKFHIPCHQSRDGSLPGNIVVTNYEQLFRYRASDFAGVVLDESSCIKNFDARRRADITEFMRTVPYRLLATATAAPNDYVELGTSAEALGHLGYYDMLSYFFINDENSLHPTALGARWRFKKAAEEPFWRWVCSWARALRRPSDLGDYLDTDFDLPPLHVTPRIVDNTTPLDGYLPGIVVEAVTIAEQRQERRANLAERCRLAAALAHHEDPVVIWTEYNAEADALVELIDGARQVSGSMLVEEKERTFKAFQDGSLRVLVTKPKIGAWGLNWQHCNRVIEFVTHSFERHYQSVRRCWRFGQKRPVYVDIIATPGEARILRNLEEKGRKADQMFNELVRLMNDPSHLAARQQASGSMEVPTWLT